MNRHEKEGRQKKQQHSVWGGGLKLQWRLITKYGGFLGGLGARFDANRFNQLY